MGLSKDKLVFDSTDLAASDDVGAYVRSSNGTLITHTNVSGKDGLDVNVINDINVTANNLDIRDLVFATDKVDVSGSEIALNAATLAALENISAIVTATDLDIRNLDHAQDNVAIKGATGNQLAVNADGSINANVDISVVNGSDKIEDSAHSTADVGTYVLSVREDSLTTSTSASGDYQSLKTDALGRMYVNESNQTAVFSAMSVLTTDTDLITTDLVNRKKVLIQNVSSRIIYIGLTGVTSSTGIKLTAGSSAELEVAASVNLHAIAVGGTADVRVLELA